MNMTEKNTIIGKENENLTLACYTLGGIPRGKTIWYHGKKKLMTIKDDNETAYYSLILNRKHNEQIYTCIAEHDMLRTPLNQSIKLDILCKYYALILVLKRTIIAGKQLNQKQTIKKSRTKVTQIGHNVNLSCSYYSNSLDAEISWTKNGQNIDYSHSNVTNIVVKSERNLTEIDLITEDAQRVTYIMFLNVTKTDEGAYTCNVTNTEGSASETVYLVVQGFSMKEHMLYSVIVVLVVLVLIIMSLVGHAYIRIRCKQSNYPVPHTDIVRQISFEIEMRDITSTERDENEILRNQQSLTNQEDTLADDRQSDLSTTHSRSSSLHSNRSQNFNEDDYLHPYHSLVHNSMDVHEYAIVERNENAEYEEIADVVKN
ncbi:unnamed protein product [Mytilus coruscus]|uniref:Ig-like domain-containing protein n=1 Tax=Mytilus coruscus TaxID=42192 RepID=A0A6J8DYF6_MYTCO|nr:unnamed protein product [Mytilus coruscus]